MKGKSTPVIIGTRGSELALWQANFTKDVLEKNGVAVELKIIKTKGDTTQQWNVSFDKIDGKGFFTKELEDALLANEIDLAVHSCKDLPTENPPGLSIAAYSKRANPFDILLIRKECVDESKLLQIKTGALVGTSSARRKAQLLALRPDIQLVDMRGNVPTRVSKLKENNFDAIVLASAGLERLNIDLSEFTTVELKSPMFIPAPAQGVLAFQVRENDLELTGICKVLNDQESFFVTTFERKILHDFEGGCQVPLGVYSFKMDSHFHTWISYANGWNEIPKRMHLLASEDGAKDGSDSKKILELLKRDSSKSVFITSDLKENDYLVRNLKAHNYDINYDSFIDFKAVPFFFDGNADWLFFSSKNGVKFFFENAGSFNPSKTKLAAINSGTAQAISEAGFKVAFKGEGSNLQQIAKDFDDISSGKITFPQAKISMQSIQKGLIKNTDIESLVIYENKPKTQLSIRKEDILVFTSPMSAEAYFTQHPLLEGQSVISIGKTTTQKLTILDIQNVKTAYDPSPWALTDEIFAIK